MLLFQHPSDPFIVSGHLEISLFWVHTDMVKQINSVYVYLLATIYDFNTPIKKLPHSGDRWTDALQLRTGH